MGPVIEEFRDRWADIMKVRFIPCSRCRCADLQPFVQKLVSKDILTDRDLDIKRLKPFRMTAKRMEIGRDRTSGQKWAYGSLTQIEKMARAMGHLVSIPSFSRGR
jgi:ATP-dependent DNA helicase MPH1